MRIGKVIGQITLSRLHPLLSGIQLKIAVPASEDDLRLQREPKSEELIVYDELAAGDGQYIAISEGGEAAMPFYPNRKPVDAYNAAILDSIRIP